VWENESNFGFPPREHRRNEELELVRGLEEEVGIILPTTKVMGTITRRPAEPTWMTASNMENIRVGCDIKQYVKAPLGYAIVGANVDSQELWIANAIGDSQFRMHGSTALVWKSLWRPKAGCTDLHSNIAETLEISHDEAKQVHNTRIDGTGIRDDSNFLSQHSGSLSDSAERAKEGHSDATARGMTGAKDLSASKQYLMRRGG
jgi:DNA polymerase gamma 1